MTQQTLDDWLAFGNHITVCPSVPHLSFVRILSILGEDAPPAFTTHTGLLTSL